LWGIEIVGASADPNGSLTLRFADGRALVVEPDDQYEAWNVTGPFGALVSLPGGGLD